MPTTEKNKHIAVADKIQLILGIIGSVLLIVYLFGFKGWLDLSNIIHFICALGILLAIFLGNRQALIACLPWLILTIIPLFTERDMLLPAPSGAIVAFDKEFTIDDEKKPCPTGWDRVEKLIGRMPIGSDEYYKRKTDGGAPSITLNQQYLLTTEGGKSSVTIEEKNLPSHQHKFKDSYGVHKNSNYGQFPVVDKPHPVIRIDKKSKQKETILQKRKNQAIKIIPPYYVVNFCRKR